MLESEIRIAQETADKDNHDPSSRSQEEVKGEGDDESQVDEYVGLSMDSAEGDATKGDEHISTCPTGVLACGKTGETVAYRNREVMQCGQGWT